MAIWMEIRCDLNLVADCWDAQNRMVEQGGWYRSVVVKRARNLGWKVFRDGVAHCPACLKASADTQSNGGGNV